MALENAKEDALGLIIELSNAFMDHVFGTLQESRKRVQKETKDKVGIHGVLYFINKCCDDTSKWVGIERDVNFSLVVGLSVHGNLHACKTMANSREVRLANELVGCKNEWINRTRLHEAKDRQLRQIIKIRIQEEKLGFGRLQVLVIMKIEHPIHHSRRRVVPTTNNIEELGEKLGNKGSHGLGSK